MISFEITAEERTVLRSPYSCRDEITGRLLDALEATETALSEQTARAEKAEAASAKSEGIIIGEEVVNEGKGVPKYGKLREAARKYRALTISSGIINDLLDRAEAMDDATQGSIKVLCDELSPCPICGKKGHPESNEKYGCVRCLNCHYETGWMESEEEAIIYWNNSFRPVKNAICITLFAKNAEINLLNELVASLDAEKDAISEYGDNLCIINEDVPKCVKLLSRLKSSSKRTHKARAKLEALRGLYWSDQKSTL